MVLPVAAKRILAAVRKAGFREGEAPAEPRFVAVRGSAGASPSHSSDSLVQHGNSNARFREVPRWWGLSSACRRTSRRRGASLMEMIVALVMLGVVFAGVAPLLSWSAAERRVAAQRQFAQLEVGNVMEQIAGQDWENLTPEQLSLTTLREEAQRFLTQAELQVAVEQMEEAVASRKVTVELRWKNRAGEFVAPERLTTWFYQHKGAE